MRGNHIKGKEHKYFSLYEDYRHVNLGNFAILFDRQYCFVNGAHINNVDIVMPRGQVATQIFMRISLSRTTSVRIQAVKGLGLRFRYCSMTS